MNDPHSIHEAIAALVHPLPGAVDIDTTDPGAAADLLADFRDAVLAAREHLAEQLEAADDAAGIDPVLTALRTLAAEIAAADAKVRDLIAYAREFLPKGAYSLEILAEATGMSPSGIRTAYGKPNTRENPRIARVAEATGTLPRVERESLRLTNGAGKTSSLERALTEALSAKNLTTFVKEPAADGDRDTDATDRGLRAFADSVRPGSTEKTQATRDVQYPEGVIPIDIEPPAAAPIDLLTPEGRQAVLDRIDHDHQTTLDYRRRLGTLAERFEADVRSVDWEQEVVPVSNAALEHLLRSGRYQNAISSRDLSLDADLDDELAQIRITRRDSAHDAAKLQTLLLHLGERFRAAQDAQLSAPPSTDTGHSA